LHKTKTINYQNLNIMNNQDLIEELKLDIQYLQAVLANGWYNGQQEKNERSAELEEYQQAIKRYTI